MAKLTNHKINYEAIRNHIFDRIHKTGEVVKNDFPNLLRGAIDAKAWEHFHDLEGKPFKTLADWLAYDYPNGTSMGIGKNALNYEEALKLTEGHPEVHRALAESAPRRKPRSPEKKNVDIFYLRRAHSGNKSVLTGRLSQEQPKFYEAYLRGEYKTITAAAIAAGLIKDDANLRRAKSAFRKMTVAERRQFQKWLLTDEAKNEAAKKAK